MIFFFFFFFFLHYCISCIYFACNFALNPENLVPNNGRDNSIHPITNLDCCVVHLNSKKVRRSPENVLDAYSFSLQSAVFMKNAGESGVLSLFLGFFI